MTTLAPPEFRLRTLIPSIYIPAVLFGVGQGAIAPIIALSARDLGASVGLAGLIVALSGIGQLIGDLPAGAFAARMGERRAMLCAVVLVCVALTICILATEVWMLGAAIATLGFASAMWGIARHTFLSEVVPYRMRARAMSSLGGTHRIGMFIGPFLGAGAMALLGTDGAYWVHLVAAVAAGLLVASIRVPHHQQAGGPNGKSNGLKTFAVLRQHLHVFGTLGVGVLMVGAVRACRQVAIPLWADHIGLDATTTSLIFGISGAVDMLLFYPAGKAMDRFGRVWVAVPCMSIMAAAYVLIPLTTSAGTLLAVAILLGFGNGMGSGIVLTLGADASPENGRAQFLGGWRLCADAGNASGPVLVSSFTFVATLGVGIWAVAGLGLLGAAALGRWIPRHD
ncbi:MFS transporter [Natronoglycomyces albus]|uniref:MFS transporter n=1 Tax=Natronoglycomyces albus TaxID=2811108 RepID=A0A895XWU2_9ACTN|nr:MFS transporter [Natronoglycomyces albus]QSB06690.1 MFS transporter [Natronoglycomyces albus]